MASEFLDDSVFSDEVMDAEDPAAGDAAFLQDDQSATPSENSTLQSAAPDAVRFGGYSGTYDGVQNCWYSSDGYVYDSAGNRIGTH